MLSKCSALQGRGAITITADGSTLTMLRTKRHPKSLTVSRWPYPIIEDESKHPLTCQSANTSKARDINREASRVRVHARLRQSQRRYEVVQGPLIRRGVSTTRPAHCQMRLQDGQTRVAYQFVRLTAIPASTIRRCWRCSGGWRWNFVHQHPRQQAHVRRRPLQHVRRHPRRHPLPGALALHHRPDVPEHLVAGRPLRQPVRHLLPTTTRSDSGIDSAAGSLTSMVVPGTVSSKRRPDTFTASPQVFFRRRR